MTRTPGDGLQADLLSDLNVDLRDRLTGSPAPTAPGPAAERLTATARPGTALPPVAPAPALEVQLTPLHWSSPRLSRSPSGTGLVLRAGPVRLCVTLR